MSTNTQLAIEWKTLRQERLEEESIPPMSDHAWERCWWLQGILWGFPLASFIFTDDCHVVEVDEEEGVYLAQGSDPHQWQEFVWLGSDEWQLGESDLGNEARISETEFAFILGQLQKQVPMSLECIKNCRVFCP